MHTWLTNQITLELKYKQKDNLLNISLFAVDNDYGVLNYDVYKISTQKYTISPKASLLAPSDTSYPRMVMEEENPSLYNPYPTSHSFPHTHTSYLLLPSKFCPTTGGFQFYSLLHRFENAI